MTKQRLIAWEAEGTRTLAPRSLSKQLDDAFTERLPSMGCVRSPSGLVHVVFIDHTYCNIQWAAYSRKENRRLLVLGWTPHEGAPTCLECVVES